MYNQSLKNINQSQTIIIDVDETEIDNVLIDLKETIDVPNNGTNIIKIQRMYVDPTGLNAKALFVYLNDLPLKGQVFHTKINCHNLIGIVPLPHGATDPFWHLNADDTCISNEIIDGRTFKSFRLKITDETGAPITFATAPILQINIEKIAGGQPDGPRLLIQQAYNK
jgi:hypothetical protein